MEITNRNMFQEIESVPTWQDAIRVSAQPLVDNGYIESSYIESMIETVYKFGDYIVLFPGFAMPHAAPSPKVKKTGFAFMRLKNAIKFSDDDSSEATVVLPIACSDSSAHIEMMQMIADVLVDDDKREVMFKSEGLDAVYDLFRKQ